MHNEIKVIQARFERIAGLAAKYGSNTTQVEFALRMVDRYLPSVSRQHTLLLDHWKSRDHNRALAELHFMLIAMDAVWRGLGVVAKINGDLARQYRCVDWRAYNDARNHFEHIDDRLYGSRRNVPEPITEDGATRTIEFGLKAGPPPQFEFGTKSIDISDEFLNRYEEWVKGTLALV